MKAAFIITSILAALSAFLVIFFEIKENKNGVLISGGAIFCFTIMSFIFQHIGQTQDQAELNRINGLLEGYISGGKGNKPIVMMEFGEQANGTFLVHFKVYNFGEDPFSNVGYEIHDSTTERSKFMSDHLKGDHPKGEDEIMALNNHMMLNQDKNIIAGNLPTLPKKLGKTIHTGLIDKYSPAVMYTIKLNWNNEFYQANYQFAFNEEQNSFRLIDLQLQDENGKATDMLQFFPTVPKEVFAGIDTNIDTIPKVYQFEMRKHNK